MGLDYGYTCGTIDSNIKDFKQVLEDEIDNLLGDASPLIEGEQKSSIIKDYVTGIYEQCQNIFEDVRKCNEDMRQQADRQIDDLENQKEDLESRVDELETEVDEKDTEISELEYELSTYRK